MTRARSCQNCGYTNVIEENVPCIECGEPVEGGEL